MSAFTDLAITLNNPLGVLYGYMLDDPALSTSLQNLPNALSQPGQPTNLPLTTVNGVVTLGTSPGLIAGHAAASQDKDTYLARRDHNALFDIPVLPGADPDKVTIFAFWRPSKLKPGGSQGYAVVTKLGRAGLTVRKTGIEASFESNPVLSTPADLIAPGGFYSAFASYDKAAKLTRLHLNGNNAAEAAYGGAGPAAINWAGGGRLYVGGHSEFADSGMSGMQSFSGILYGHALGITGLAGSGESAGEQLIRNLHLAALNSPNEVPGKVMYVATWSRLILPANPARKRARLDNDDDTPLYYALEDPAEPRKGAKLMPYDDPWETPNPYDRRSTVYTGPVYMVHESPYGLKRVLVHEE